MSSTPALPPRQRGRAATAALLVVGLALVSSCDSDRPVAVSPLENETLGNADATPQHHWVGDRKMRDTPFERSWDVQLPHGVRAAWINPHIPDLLLIELKGSSHELIGIDAFSGNTRWVAQDFPKSLRLPPDVTRVTLRDVHGKTSGPADDRVWTIADDTLYCLDAIYGQIIWRYNLPFSPSTGPLAIGSDTDERVFIGDWDGRVQVVGYLNDKHLPYSMWQYNVHSPITATPIEYDGLVYVADQSGTVHCFTADREEKWNHATGNTIHGSPLLLSRSLFIGNDNNVLFALDRLTGQPIGSIYLNGTIKRTPFAFKAEGGRVYVWVDDKDHRISGLYAVKAMLDNIPFLDTSRHPIEVERLGVDWFVPGVDRLVGSDPDNLYVTSGHSPVVHAINRASGKIVWSWDISEQHHAVRNIDGSISSHEVAFIAQYQDATDQNRSIYTVDDTGHVIAYRVYGDKPGDPLSGDRVRTISAKAFDPNAKPDAPAKPDAAAPDAAKPDAAKPDAAAPDAAKPDAAAPADAKPADK